MKKLLTSLLLSLMLLVPLVHAAEGEEESRFRDNFSGGCIANDYLPFIVDTARYSGNKELNVDSSRKAYITDIWKLSYCQVYDVLDLHDQLEALRDSYRSAAASCSDTGEQKYHYKSLLMELYFVRNSEPMPRQLVGQVDEDYLKWKVSEKIQMLQEQMFDTFVESKLVTAKEFDEIFRRIVEKYEKRMPDYVKCSDGPWAEIQEPFYDFAATMLKISMLRYELEMPDLKAQYSWENLKAGGEGGGAQGTLQVNDRPPISFKEAFNSFRQRQKEKKQNTIQPLTASGFSTPLASGETKAYTIDEAINALETSRADYSIAVRHNERIADYEIMYGEFGAQASSDLSNMVHAMNSLVKTSSRVELPIIIEGAGEVYDKQCR